MRDAILPAGGTIGGEFAEEAGTQVKALIKIGGITLLERAVRALQESGGIEKIVVIGDESVREEANRLGVSEILAPGTTAPDNIFRGLDWLQKHSKNPQVLMVTTDLPSITGEMISRFLELCPPSAEVALPIMTQAEYEARFLNAPGEYVPLGGDFYTIGSVALLDADVLRRNRVHLEQVFEARKSQLGLARLLGVGFVMKFLLKKLTVQDIETRCKKLLRCEGAAVPHSPSELALDIDTLEDYRYALTLEAHT